MNGLFAKCHFLRPPVKNSSPRFSGLARGLLVVKAERQTYRPVTQCREDKQMAIVWSSGKNQNTNDAAGRSERKLRLSRRRRLQLVAIGQGIAALSTLTLAIVAVHAGVRTASDRLAILNIAPTIPMAVRTGDTLWSLAQRYGNPAEPVLDRIDTLAHANGIKASTTLVPGQRLMVPVQNPVEVARIAPLMASR
ncbi:MAG: LysM peptidoglycan-binding domain-containing protein [Armatimonadota bacterium]